MKKYVAIIGTNESQPGLNIQQAIGDVWADSPETLLEGIADILGLTIVVSKDNSESSGAV